MKIPVYLIHSMIYYRLPHILLADESNDPWEKLSPDSNGLLGDSRSYADGFVRIYELMQKIGAYGAVLTALFALIEMAYRVSSPQAVSKGKDTVFFKLLIVFLICCGAAIAGWILSWSADISGLT